MKNKILLAAALLPLWCTPIVGHASTLRTTEAVAVASANSQRGAEAPAWWAAFGETSLDQLQAAARASSGLWDTRLQAEVARAYVMLRVQNLRAHNTAELREVSRKERELLATRSPTREVAQLLSALDERTAAAERHAINFAQQRDAALRRLVELTPTAADKAKAALVSALDDQSLPSFRREVPQRLPASVLLSRADVAEVERLMAANSSLSILLSGWIGPAAQPAPLALPGDEAGVDDTLRQAGREVSWSLRQLIDARQAAAADARRMEARRLEVMAMQRRVEAGDADPAQVLGVYQQMLAEVDTLLQAQGHLALAWIALHAQAPGTLSALAVPQP